MLSRSIALLILAFAPLVAIAQGCGSLKNLYGPFDYRTDKKHLELVEAYHFTPDVATLRRGSTGSIGSDLDYTLRAFPNHHLALNAMANLALKTNSERPRGARYTVDCYFDRALTFAGNDGLVRIIYGVYLSRTKRPRDAVRVLETARQYEPDNPNLFYNLGLAYCDLKDYPNALKNAHEAYRLGSPLPGLRDKLDAAGRWREEPASDEHAGAASATGPAAPK
jgi:predicted Zn-dependent protease